MKKLFVICATGAGLKALEKAKKALEKEALELKKGVEIICVESIEDIPLKERLISDPSIIQEIYTISAAPILPSMTYFYNKKRKGYERPYKDHS